MKVEKILITVAKQPHKLRNCICIANSFLILTFTKGLTKADSKVCFFNRESVAGSVIQTTGTVEFEDGLWIGNHLKA